MSLKLKKKQKKKKKNKKKKKQEDNICQRFFAVFVVWLTH